VADADDPEDRMGLTLGEEVTQEDDVTMLEDL